MIFLCGHHNSGKTTVARFLEAKGFIHVETGDIARAIHGHVAPDVHFHTWAQDVNAENPDYINEKIAQYILDLVKRERLTDSFRIVVTGNRQLSGIRYLVKHVPSKCNVVIFLETPIRSLYERQANRTDRKLENDSYEWFVNTYLAFDRKMGIEAIRQFSDFVVDGSRGKDAVCLDVLSVVERTLISAK